MSCHYRLGQELQRDITIELRIRRSPHFTHTAFADLGGDLIRAEGRSGFERHREEELF